jgi:hypothetical protein
VSNGAIKLLLSANNCKVSKENLSQGRGHPIGVTDAVVCLFARVFARKDL